MSSTSYMIILRNSTYGNMSKQSGKCGLHFWHVERAAGIVWKLGCVFTVQVFKKPHRDQKCIRTKDLQCAFVAKVFKFNLSSVAKKISVYLFGVYILDVKL